MKKTVMFVGHGRAGKDTACEYLSKITTLRNAGTTSKYLCEYVAAKLGLPVEEAYARRHESDEMRTFWYNCGNELRENGPTTLIRRALAHGEITGGVRDYDEIVAAKDECIIDIIVWIDNNRVKPDPTVKFTSREADLIIENHWGLDEFYERIERFARFAQLPLRGDVGRLDNTVEFARRDQKGRLRLLYGESHAQHKLSSLQVEEIRELYRTGNWK